MYLKHIIKELKSSAFMNTIIVVQMVIVFICTMAASSIVTYYYNCYHKTSDLYKSKGEIYRVDGVVHKTIPLNSSKNLEELLVKCDIFGMYDTWALYFDNDMKEYEYRTISYDREIIETYTPKLKEGRWINPNRDDGVVEAVIVENEYNLSVGDKLIMCDVYMAQPDRCLEVEIVGIMEDGARFIGQGLHVTGEGSRANLEDYRDIYVDYFLEEQKIPVMLTSVYSVYMSSYMKKNNCMMTELEGLLFINYNSGITEEEIEYNKKVLNRDARITGKISMDEFRQNSIATIKEKLYGILPIFICVFILVIISGMCNFAISIKKHMRDYTVFAICGMPWRMSTIISIIKSLIMCTISLIMSFVLVYIGLRMEIIKQTTLELGFIPLLACVIVGAIYILVSAIMPYALVKGTNLNSELRNCL